MRKRKMLYAVLGTVGLLSVLLAAGVGTVYAYGPRPPVDVPQEVECPYWASGEGVGGWMRGGLRWGMRGVSLVEATAQATGLSEDEVIAALESGQTFAQIAEAQGVDPQAIVDAFVAEREEMLEEAVSEGRLTQEQADEMLEEMSEHLAERLSEPWTPFGGTEGWNGHGRPTGRGMRPGAGFPSRFFPHQ